MSARERHVAPGPTVRQVAGRDPEGRYILSCLVKQTFDFDASGRLRYAEEQQALVDEPEDDPDNPQLLASDTDLYPYKPLTDVVVKGHAYGYSGRQAFDALVKVGSAEKRIRVFGDRRMKVTSAGQLLFSQPKPVEAVPLSYAHAYGGRDQRAEDKYGNVYSDLLGRAAEFFPGDLADASLWAYPRNPAGMGYAVRPSRNSLQATLLPNLEDPTDLLTPERLIVGEQGAWTRMPLPQATDWVGYGWFPRVAYFGVAPPFSPDAPPTKEIQRGLVPEDLLGTSEPIPDHLAFRMTCGASLGLQLPYLRGGETVYLESLHPEQPRWQFQIPAQRPQIWTDGRQGKFNPTDPVLHTVLIEPDEGRLTLVWRGSAPALRPYLPDELEKMPLRVQF